MADYIDRNAAINVLCSTERKEVDADSRVWVDRAEVVRKLSKLPTADVKPVVHGRWIRRNVRGALTNICSACNEDGGVLYDYDICPCCGAVMDMRGNDND